MRINASLCGGWGAGVFCALWGSGFMRGVSAGQKSPYGKFVQKLDTLKSDFDFSFYEAQTSRED
jgi:hypothetical protein